MAALICLFLVGGCGDDDIGGDQGEAQPAGQEAPASGGCEDVPRALVEAIVTGLTVQGDGREAPETRSAGARERP